MEIDQESLDMIIYPIEEMILRKIQNPNFCSTNFIFDFLNVWFGTQKIANAYLFHQKSIYVHRNGYWFYQIENLAH